MSWANICFDIEIIDIIDKRYCFRLQRVLFIFLFFAGFRHSAAMAAAAASDKNAACSSQQTAASADGPATGMTGSSMTQQHVAPPVVRITLASMEECNVLLHNGLDFYGATFFPVEAASPVALKKKPLAPNRYDKTPGRPPPTPLSKTAGKTSQTISQKTTYSFNPIENVSCAISIVDFSISNRPSTTNIAIMISCIAYQLLSFWEHYRVTVYSKRFITSTTKNRFTYS